MDISGLVKYGLKKINLGDGYPSIYVIDKNNENYLKAEGSSQAQMEGKEASTGKWGDIILAVNKNINPNPAEGNEATADSAITNYDVVTSDDGDVYLVWTEYRTVLKDNDASRAADPENQERKKQIFAARWQPETQIERVQLDYIDENGEDEFTVEGSSVRYQYVYSKGKGYYPDKIKVNGVAQIIDYSGTPDVNGFIGGAKAGDPIIKQNYVPTDKTGWSKPIQITTGQGANYDELGVAALEGNEGVKIAFIKYIQTLENAGGNKKIFRQDISSRTLGLLTFRPASGVEFTNGSISFGREMPRVGEKVAVSAFVKNTGINAIRDARVEFYQIVDGIETLVDTKFNGTYTDSGAALVGGDEFNV